MSFAPQLQRRERIVARRLSNAIPDPRTADRKQDGSYVILLTDEADYFLNDVIDRTRETWELTNPTTTIGVSTPVLLQSCKIWLRWIAEGWTPAAVLTEISRSQRDSVRYDYASMLFLCMLEALASHAVMIFPQWPPDPESIPNGY